MKLIKRLLLLACLVSGPQLLAFGDAGEYYNIATGTVFGVGYKEIVQNQPTGIAVPAVTAGLVVELCLSILITSKVIQWNNLPERRNVDKYAINVALIYASSLIFSLGLYGFEKYMFGNPKGPLTTEI